MSNNANVVKYKTFPSALSEGEQACYIGKPIHKGTRDRAYLIQKVADRIGMDKAMVGCAIDLFFEQCGIEMRDGFRVEYGEIAGNLTIQGGFPTKDADWDATRNKLVPRLHAKGDLAACTADVVCENETPLATVTITSVMDTTHKTESELAQGTNVVIYVAGKNTLTSTDVTSGEGCWIEEEETGLVAAIGTVTASTMTTLNATFATMPEPGKYRFVLATRGGMGSEYGIVQAKRKVTVVAVDNQ